MLMPPPSTEAVFPLTVVPETVNLPELKNPPPDEAELLVIVELRSVITEPAHQLWIPPPRSTELLSTMLSFSVSDPALEIPPPSLSAALRSITLRESVTVPTLKMPPPLARRDILVETVTSVP